jgi:hypothetical protein
MAGTDVLPKRNEQAIDLDPVAARQFGGQRGCRSFRGRGIDISPAIRDTMHVNIHRDTRLSAGNSEHEVRAFDPNTRKGH